MISSLLLSLGIGIVNGAAVFAVLAWAYKKSDKVFYGAFFGGFVWKLCVLAATAYFVYGNPRFHFAAVLVSLAAVTFVFSLAAIFLLKKVYGF